MNLDPGQLDHIVREVVARLTGSPADVGRNGSGMHALNSQVPKADTGSDTSLATLHVSGRLVTLQTIEGRLTKQHRHVSVEPGAVVTPAVIDLLRDRRVALQRTAGQLAATAEVTPNAAPCIGLVVEPNERQWLAKLLIGSHRHVVLLHGADELIAALTTTDPTAVCASGGMIVTNRWAARACEANRNANVCAASVSSLAELDDALSQAPVNLVVVNGKQATQHVCRQMLRRLAQAVEERAR